MQRITITIDDDMLERLDALCAERGYPSRSEAMRDVLRAGFADPDAGVAPASAGTEACFAALTYVYDHRTRELARRLTDTQHHHHDLSVVTTHVHIDDDSCLEVAILKGRADELRAFADGVVHQRGVRHGRLHLIPAPSTVDGGHDHGHMHE